MRIQLSSSGDFRKTEKFLSTMQKRQMYRDLEQYGRQGVAALASATPAETGLAASSWTYEIKKSYGYVALYFKNTNIENGFPVAIMIQLGHGTGTGGYVSGIDYINPALRPIFDQMVNTVWKAVTSA